MKTLSWRQSTISAARWKRCSLIFEPPILQRWRCKWSTEERMAPLYDVITFDCYGTLIDWEGGISTAFASAAAAETRQLDRMQLLKAYAELEPSVEAAPYRRYREVLTETAQRVAERLGWPLSREAAHFLAESLP